MPKRHDCLIIGAALVDILAETGQMKKVVVPGNYIEHRIYLSLASKNTLKSAEISPGGSALNVAVTMRGMGSNTALLTCLGQDVFGDFILDSIKKTQINASFVKRAKAQTGIGINLISSGEKSCLAFHGAVDELGEKDLTGQMVAGSRLILITSLASKKNYALFLKVLSLAKKHTVPVIFAPSITMLREHADKIRKLNYKFEMVILNYEEGSFLTHKKGVREILEALPGRVTVVTKDREGAYAREGKRMLAVSTAPVKVVNTTGVGDSFCGAFVHTYFKTCSLEKSLKAGTAVAHMNLSTMETEIRCSKAQISSFLKKHGKNLRVTKM